MSNGIKLNKYIKQPVVLGIDVGSHLNNLLTGKRHQNKISNITY